MANDTARWLGRAIQERRSEIVQRWLERVQQDVLRTPGVSITQLRDGMPDYLTGLSELLASGGDAAGGRRAAWERVAREHGVTRVRIGFDISQLVHEFIVLRQVIRDVVAEQAQPPPDVEAVLADLLDAAIASSVQSYVDARDYEARRRQAENIGFITHELRNPLSTAMLIVAQLQTKMVEEVEARVAPPVVERLERSLRAIEQLIASVLLTEKLEAGKQEARAVPVRLVDVVGSAVEAARRVAAQKGLAFNVSYDPNLTVRVDPMLTRSAIQNLADNAAKYTDAGSVDIVVSTDGGALVVDVRDTCDGLSAEELKTIFEPFQRGRTRQAGTGLGLAIARRAAEAQGGTIEAESSGASGCHFQLRLPGAVDE
jgi:signal transduction histidine kinase